MKYFELISRCEGFVEFKLLNLRKYKSSQRLTWYFVLLPVNLSPISHRPTYSSSPAAERDVVGSDLTNTIT